jgi:uncharacterized protein YodC (DUF2158 family)
MANTFKIGDVVRLKSGGPHMTVAGVGSDHLGNPLVICQWFRDDADVKEATFHADALESVH